ncbi:MAG: SMC-Scp complex subunit ScpB [Clostridia bacterium]|nr:SMC-Scp complex subunit ScpB [Clostridia bacterium]
MTDNNKLLETAPCEHPEAAIEAILFAAGHPISYETLAETLGYKTKEIRKIVKQMTETYDGRGIMLLAFDDTCQLCTREEFLSYIRTALGIKRGGNLSASSMEVLAIVAYNQPVTRAFIDAVRGVDSSYATSSLCEKGLIEVTGHLDAPGRPSLLCTTDKFLRVFGLSSITELPPAEQLIMAPPESGEQIAMDPETADGASEDTPREASSDGATD